MELTWVTECKWTLLIRYINTCRFWQPGQCYAIRYMLRMLIFIVSPTTIRNKAKSGLLKPMVLMDKWKLFTILLLTYAYQHDIFIWLPNILNLYFSFRWIHAIAISEAEVIFWIDLSKLKYLLHHLCCFVLCLLISPRNVHLSSS